MLLRGAGRIVEALSKRVPRRSLMRIKRAAFAVQHARGSIAAAPRLGEDLMNINGGRAGRNVQSPDARRAPIESGFARAAPRGTRFANATNRRDDAMHDATTARNADASNSPDDVPEEPIPAIQQLLDNPFLLLFLGIAMPTVLYIVWGVMEIVGIPVAK